VVKPNEPLFRHTTFQIGGPADFFTTPLDLEDVINVERFCREEGIPRFTIGNGSNLLVSDDGYRGVVLDLSAAFRGIRSKGNWIEAGSGVVLNSLVQFAIGRGLSGLESLAGIPGQVGGGVRLNAGAYGGEISDRLVKVRILDRFGTVESIPKERIDFGYRHMSLSSDNILLGAEFELADGNPFELERAVSINLKKRKDKQPLSLPSAGSVFKRPPGDFAGRLIEEAGLKGLRIGDAMISKKHANFIVNCGQAKADDVRRLIDAIQAKVLDVFRVEIEPEIHFLGFESV
jgi:UDP-N-acetylmuramate dehydrogenase